VLLLAAVGAAAAEPVPVTGPTAAPRRVLLRAADPQAPQRPPVVPTAQATPAAVGNADCPVHPSQTTSATARPAFSLSDLKAQYPQNKQGHFQMELPAILNTSTDLEVQALLAGQSVETTGQVMPETVDNADGRHVRIFRSQLLCCATHARQCSVALELPEATTAFKESTWVKLVGTLSFRREERRIVPVIIVTDIKETAAPANPLLD
jgi:hypothetical protein